MHHSPSVLFVIRTRKSMQWWLCHLTIWQKQKQNAVLFYFSFLLTLESNTWCIVHGTPLPILEWLVFSSISYRNRGNNQESLPAYTHTSLTLWTSTSLIFIWMHSSESYSFFTLRTTFFFAFMDKLSVKQVQWASMFAHTHTAVSFSLLTFALWTVFVENSNKIICFSQTQQYFSIYFNLMVTSFDRETINRPSLQEILKIGYMYCILNSMSYGIP